MRCVTHSPYGILYQNQSYHLRFDQSLSIHHLGELDVDMNAGSQRTTKPVENLYFPSKVLGRYSVSVNHFANKGGKDPTEFVVLIREQGKAAKRIKGEISSGNPKKEIFAVHIR